MTPSLRNFLGSIIAGILIAYLVYRFLLWLGTVDPIIRSKDGN